MSQVKRFIRPVLRSLAFVAATLFLSNLLSSFLFILVAVVLDPTGETMFRVFEFGGGWPLFVGSLLLAGTIVWRFLPIRRRITPQH